MNRPGVLIRPARREDARAIQGVYASGVLEGRFPVDYDASDWLAYAGVPHVKLLVAEFAGRIVGMCLGYDLVRWGYLDVLVVDPRCRSRKVGSGLYDAFMAVGRGRWSTAEASVDPREVTLKNFIRKRRGIKSGGTAEWLIQDL